MDKVLFDIITAPAFVFLFVFVLGLLVVNLWCIYINERETELDGFKRENAGHWFTAAACSLIAASILFYTNVFWSY